MLYATHLREMGKGSLGDYLIVEKP